MNRLAALIIFSATLFNVSPVSALPVVVDLGVPGQTPNVSTSLGFPGNDRNIVFDALNNVTITSAEIAIDPLAGGATEIGVQIYDMNMALTGGVGSRNALLASATVGITDVGLTFYGVPIDFTFLAGTRYNLAFTSVAPTNSWGLSGLNNMELYIFDFNFSMAYSPGGLLTVLDGGLGNGLNGDFTNGAMPHVRLYYDYYDDQPQVSTLTAGTTNSVSVPEPTSIALLSLGLFGIRFLRRSEYTKKGKRQ